MKTPPRSEAELSGKVKDFVGAIPERGGGALGGAGGRRSTVEEDAIMALVALGERRVDAEHLLDRVKQSNPAAKTTQLLVGEMLRMRTVRA